MSELRSLLAFMDAEDRNRAIQRYEAMFDAAGDQGEEALLNALGSPVRQVLVVEKEVREARKKGEVPFSHGAVPQPTMKQDRSSELARMLRAAAEELENESAQTLAPTTGDAPDAGEEDDFPIEDYYFAAPPTQGEPQLAEAETLSPAEAAPEETSLGVPTELTGDTADVEEDYPEEESSPNALPADAFPTEQPETPEEEPPSAEAEEPATPAEPAEEPTAQKKAYPERPPAKKPTRQKSSGSGRVFAAVLVTVPFIVFWVFSFALFITLGTAVAALGFGLCVAGLYLGGYLFNGVITFIPDMLLIGGGTLLFLSVALLLLWTGLWIAAGGCEAVIRFSRGTYRRILGIGNEREAEDDG